MQFLLDLKLMKLTKIILLFTFLFCFQSWTKADDISDFQIEGMSIGDSALVYFSEKEIKKGIQYNYYNDDLYFASQIDNTDCRELPNSAPKGEEAYFGRGFASA